MAIAEQDQDSRRERSVPVNRQSPQMGSRMVEPREQMTEAPHGLDLNATRAAVRPDAPPKILAADLFDAGEAIAEGTASDEQRELLMSPQVQTIVRELQPVIRRFRRAIQDGRRRQVVVPTRCVPRRARARGAGRPRAHAARSSAASGDSGDDGPGEPPSPRPASRRPRAILTFAVTADGCGAVIA